MSLEIFGIRDLNLEEWDCVSGGDGGTSIPPPGPVAPNTAVNDPYNQVIGMLGAISPLVECDCPPPCVYGSNTSVDALDLNAGAVIGTTSCNDGANTCYTYTEGGYTDILPYYVTINGQAAGSYDTSGLCP